MPVAGLRYGTNTTLALSFEADSLGTQHVTDDSWTYPSGFTATGSAVISDTHVKFGNNSLYFPQGGSLVLNAPLVTYADFTIEFWLYVASYPGSTGYFLTTGMGYMSFDVTSTIKFPGGVSIPMADMAINTWHHIAICRYGSVVKSFLNGVVRGSAASTLASTSMTIGFPAGINGYDSQPVFYIDDFGFADNYAHYTAAFTPPTTPFLEPPSVSGVNLTETYQFAPGSASGSLITIDVNDPYWNNVTFMLHGIGAPNYQPAIDSTGKPILNHGVYVSTASSAFSNTSLYFDGSINGMMELPASNALDADMDFTFEAWVRPAPNIGGYSRQMHIFGHGTSWRIWTDDNTLFYAHSGYDGQTPYTETSAGMALTPDVWSHIAVTRSGNTIQLYVNGVAGTPMTAVHYPGKGAIAAFFWDATQQDNYGWDLSYGIGSTHRDDYHSLAYRYTGYMDEIRFTRGIARYVGTDTFTVPNARFISVEADVIGDPYWNDVVLLVHGNEASGSSLFFRDQKNHTVVAGGATVQASTSGLFGNSINLGALTSSSPDGKLTVSDHSDFDLSAGGDFTIELSVFVGVSASGLVSKCLVPANYGVFPTDGWLLHYTGSTATGAAAEAGTVQWDQWDSTGAHDIALNTSGMLPNRWYHIAVVRKTGYVTIYVDGRAGTSYPMPAVKNLAADLLIGVKYPGDTGQLNQVDDIRITKAARYP